MIPPGSELIACHEAEPAAAATFAPNVNPRTGLATDYLNHFSEALMLLETVGDAPHCADDFLGWQPKSYREHFEGSGFTGRGRAIAAYDAADPVVRQEFDAITAAMGSILQAVRTAMQDTTDDAQRAALARQTAGCIRPLLTLAASLISGAGRG